MISVKSTKWYIYLAFIVSLSFVVVSCSESPVGSKYDTEDAVPRHVTLAKVTVNEGFETGTKTAYAAADVTLGSGVWNLSDALIGNSASDVKNGTKSARIVNTGKVTMKFNRTDGIGVVTVKHAKFGTDANSTWELWYSVNSGSTWTKSGSTVTTSTTTLATASFTINKTGTVRIEIRKVSGGAARINIDDIVINDYAPGDTGGSGNPGTVHLTLGNPSAAVTNVSYPANYLMIKPQYAMSYHRDYGKPNWVAWHLDPTWLGSAPRQDNFRADASLPSGWYRVGATSYSGSGFDRGHMCPSADRTANVTDNGATFFMTNMIPQAPDNNQGPWAKLEDYERTLVNAGNELYIYSGSYGVGGTGSSGAASTINGGKVTVPNRVWKIIVVLPQGTNDLARVSTSTRVIAVNLPNTQGIRSVSWGTYRVSVDAIESATGYNFLSEVSTSIQNVIEAVVDNGPTN